MSPRDVARPIRLLLCAVLIAAGLGLRPALAATEVQRVVSPGGIEAWLVETDAVDVIALEFAFRGGSNLDPEDLAGLAYMASITLDEGAGPHGSEAFQDLLADNAISMSFRAGSRSFNGSVKVAVERAEVAWDLLRLALTEPRFDPEPVNRMRTSAISRLRRDSQDIGWYAGRAFYQTALPGTPHSRPTRGTVASLSAIGPEELRAFAEGAFTRANLYIGVTGAISAEELAPVLDQIFGALPEGEPVVPLPDYEVEGLGLTVLVERPAQQASIMFGQTAVERHDPDFYPAYVMNYILGGGGFESRLTSEVREARGLTYGIGTTIADFEGAPMILGSSQLTAGRAAEAVAVIREEWGRMAEGGVTPVELEDAKTYLTGSFPLRYTSTDRIASALVGMQIEDLGIDWFETRNDEVEAVTLEQVNAIAARILIPDALLVVVAGPRESDLATDLEIDGQSLLDAALTRPE